jgi:hypothetical protein
MRVEQRDPWLATRTWAALLNHKRKPRHCYRITVSATSPTTSTFAALISASALPMIELAAGPIAVDTALITALAPICTAAAARSAARACAAAVATDRLLLVAALTAARADAADATTPLFATAGAAAGAAGGNCLAHLYLYAFLGLGANEIPGLGFSAPAHLLSGLRGTPDEAVFMHTLQRSFSYCGDYPPPSCAQFAATS